VYGTGDRRWGDIQRDDPIGDVREAAREMPRSAPDLKRPGVSAPLKASQATAHTSPAHIDRRRFLGITAMTMAAAHLGTRDVAHGQSRTTPPAALPTISRRTHTSFDALKHIEAGVLQVGYAEAGPAEGPAVILLHGWGPYDIYSYVDVAPVLAAAGYRVLVPYLRGYGTTRSWPMRRPGTASRRCSLSISSPVMEALAHPRRRSSPGVIGARGRPTPRALWPRLQGPWSP